MDIFTYKDSLANRELPAYNIAKVAEKIFSLKGSFISNPLYWNKAKSKVVKCSDQ
jgi:hypothetical protein